MSRCSCCIVVVVLRVDMNVMLVPCCCCIVVVLSLVFVGVRFVVRVVHVGLGMLRCCCSGCFSCGCCCVGVLVLMVVRICCL